MCLVHNVAWHEGETCKEFDYRKSHANERHQKRQEKASNKAISRLTKKCPGRAGNCGWNIEKNGGCDHMTCLFPFLDYVWTGSESPSKLWRSLLCLHIGAKCQHEFCWVCLAPYTSIRLRGNMAHKWSCKHHSWRIGYVFWLSRLTHF